MIDVEHYKITQGDGKELSKISPDDTGQFEDSSDGKKSAKKLLDKQQKRLGDLQNLLYADGSHALLIVLQALDAGGKDSTIRKVMTGMNPQGVRVTSFKAPSELELKHDFLWRIHQAAPAKGMIGVFNRSHYEDVLAVRVKNLVPESVWRSRYKHINAFEQHLSDANTKIIKLYLHINKEEQKERFESRLQEAEKHWKFNPSDLSDRALWPEYQQAFEDVFANCASPDAPWFIIPANKKWYRNVVVAQIIINALESLPLAYPTIDYDPDQITIPD